MVYGYDDDDCNHTMSLHVFCFLVVVSGIQVIFVGLLLFFFFSTFSALSCYIILQRFSLKFKYWGFFGFFFYHNMFPQTLGSTVG